MKATKRSADLFPPTHRSFRFIAHLVVLMLWSSSLPAAASIEPTKLANRLFPTNTSSTYASGTSVAMHNDVLIVGDPVAGAAYVFNRNAGGADNWGQVKTLSPDSPPKTGFGTAVACDGTSIIVGSPNERAAYVFMGSGSFWDRNDKIEMFYQPSFGGAVAVSGKFVVVGAPNGYTYSGAGYEGDAGAAYLFDRDALSPNDRVGGQGDKWGVVVNGPTLGYGYPEGNLFGGGVTLFNASGNHFGASVVISGNFIAVGSPDAEPGANPNLGIVSLFRITNVQGTNSWQYTAPLGAQYRISGGKFGASLAISGNQLVVGEPQSNRAYLYELLSDFVPGEYNWRQLHLILPQDGLTGNFGSKVGFDGNNIVVSAPNQLSPFPGQNTAKGAVYVFNNSGSLQKKLISGGCETDAQFGASVAISGGLIAVGATNKPPNTTRGAVWLSEGVSENLLVRWATDTSGFFAEPTNWDPQKVPAPCEIIRLERGSLNLKSIDFAVPAGGEHQVAELQARLGSWELNLNSFTFNAARQVEVSLGATLNFRNALLKTPKIDLKPGSRLTTFLSDSEPTSLKIGSGASLVISNGTLTVTNLTLESNSILGWDNGSINVETNLFFPDVLVNIELRASGVNSPTPLFKVNDLRKFRAGGTLNFIPNNYNPKPGDRFRLIEFKAETKIAEEIYNLYRFKNYNANIINNTVGASSKGDFCASSKGDRF